MRDELLVQIRDYVNRHWRDTWMDNKPGRGTVNDAFIVLMSSVTAPEWKARISDEFERLIAAEVSK